MEADKTDIYPIELFYTTLLFLTYATARRSLKGVLFYGKIIKHSQLPLF